MQDFPPPPKAHHYILNKKFLKKDLFGSIVKIPPAPQAEVAYKDLVFTEEDRLNIHELITTMSQNNKFQLLFKQSHLKTLGAQINHVHPLKFLAAIFTQAELKSLMGNIQDDHFKWNGLMDGLGPSLTREAIKGKLEFYLHDFAHEIELPPEDILPYFQSRDWENFVRFLIQSSTSSL
jgi:hypothetical protein